MIANSLKALYRFSPAITALILQMLAFGLAFISMSIFTPKLSLLGFAFVCGIFAAAMTYWANLARWWLLIQLLFAPAVVATLTLKIPPYLFLFAFLALLLVYWNTFRTQVPLYLSSNKVWQALETLLPASKVNQNFNFIDIGSGLGGVLTYLAKVRPDGIYSGVESAPLPFFWSWLRIRLGGYRQCRLQWGDLWDCHLADYDVVFAYLSPAPMERLWIKARSEMRPGTLFISSTFNVPGETPSETLQIDDLHRSTLLLWRM